MSWLVKEKLETTGDFKLDFVLQKLFPRELEQEYAVERVKYQDFQILSKLNVFTYRRSYTYYNPVCKYKYLLYTVIFHDSKTIYVHIDTED